METPPSPWLKAAYWSVIVLVGLGSGALLQKLFRATPPPEEPGGGRFAAAPLVPAMPAATKDPTAPGPAGSDSLSLLVPEAASAPPDGQASARRAVAEDREPPASRFEGNEDAEDDRSMGAIEGRSGRPRFQAAGAPGKGGGHAAAGSGGAGTSASTLQEPRFAAASGQGAQGSGTAPLGGTRQRAFDSRLARRSSAGADPAGNRPFETAMGALPPGAPVGDAVLVNRGPESSLPPEPSAPAPPPAPEGAEEQEQTGGGLGPSIDPRFGKEDPSTPTPPKLYRIRTKGGEKWSEARELKPTLKDFESRLRLNASYRMQLQGETAWGSLENRSALMAHLEWRLGSRFIGDVIIVEGVDPFGKPEGAWLIRIVRKDPKPPVPVNLGAIQPASTIGNNRVDLMHGAVWKQFPDLESWGICNCRKIAQSTSWSQHAYCNGEDLHRDVKGQSYQQSMDPIARWLYANREALSIEHIIWRRDTKCDDPTYDHCNHIHVDMKPNGTGTPACAR